MIAFLMVIAMVDCRVPIYFNHAKVTQLCGFTGAGDSGKSLVTTTISQALIWSLGVWLSGHLDRGYGAGPASRVADEL